MAMVLTQSRLRVTQAIYFGKPPGGGGGTVTAVAGGNGITATPGPIVGVGNLDLGPLTADHDFGNFYVHTKNSSRWFNVRAYGALGNDTGDDGVAINLAIADAELNGGTVYFPIGFYRITTPLAVTTPIRGLVFQGETGAYANPGSYRGSTIRWAGAISNTMLAFLNDQDIVIDGICFDGTSIAGTVGVSLDSNGASPSRRTTIRNCMFRRLETGAILGNSGNQIDTVWMSNTAFYEGQNAVTSTAILMNSANLTANLENVEMTGWRYGIHIANCGNVTFTHVNGGNVAADPFDLFHFSGSWSSVDATNCEAEGPGAVSHIVLAGTAASGVNAPISFHSCSLGTGTFAAAARVTTESCHFNGTFTYGTNGSYHTSINDSFPVGTIAVGATTTIVTYVNQVGFSVGTTPSTNYKFFGKSTGYTEMKLETTSAVTGAISEYLNPSDRITAGLRDDLKPGSYIVRQENAPGPFSMLWLDGRTGLVGLNTTTAPTRHLDLNGVQRWRGQAAPAVSEANSGTIYFDSATNKLKASLNGSAYVDVIGSGGLTGSGSTGRVAYWDSVTSVASPTAIYVDAVNNRLGINNAIPAYDLDVTGDVNVDTGIYRYLGSVALAFDTFTGRSWVACGGLVLPATGLSSTVVGYGAGTSATGAGLTAVGTQAGQTTTGDGVTAIGNSALLSNTTGAQNTAVGSAAGFSNTTGADNVFIGYGADANANNYTNAIAIGSGSIVGASDSMVLGDASMKVGIRTSTPAHPLDVDGAVAFRHKDIAVVNGLNSDIALTDASLIRLTGPAGAFSIGGFTGGTDGRVLRIINTTAQAMTIVNLDAGSAATNQITTLTGADVVLAARTSAATLVYEDVSDTWLLLNWNG
jgi:hypothetical protein